jgi:phage gp29-like protein
MPPRPPPSYTPPTYQTPLGTATTGRFAELPHSARQTYELASDIDQAIGALDVGQYRDAAILWDAMLSDDKIAGDLETRIAGVLSAPLRARPPKDTAKGRKLAELIAGTDEDPGLWEQMFPAAALYQLVQYGLGLNLGIGELVWDTDAPRWQPRLRVWHPQHAWFNWGRRAIWLQTMAGPVELPTVEDTLHSDGRWIIFQPWGGGNFPYLYGLVRPLATWFLARRLTIRDSNRYSERQGQAWVVGEMPAQATPEQKGRFRDKLFNPGNNTAMTLESLPNGQKFAVSMVESTAATWQVFPAMWEMANKAIGTVLLGQDATSTAAGGSLAQFKGSIRYERQKRDARDLTRVLNQQGLHWWAEYNEGDGAWAPQAYYETEPPDDEKAEADALLALAQALGALATSGAPVDLRAVADEHGLPLLDEETTIAGAVSWQDAIEAVRGAVSVEDAARRLEQVIQGEQAAPAQDGAAPAPRQSEGNAAPPALEITPTDIAAIVKVDEARQSVGLAPLGGEDGALTIAEYKAKYAQDIAKAAGADEGIADGEKAQTEAAMQAVLSGRTPLPARAQALLSRHAGTALARTPPRLTSRDLALRARQLLAGLDTAELAQEVRAAAPRRPKAAAKRAGRYADRLATAARQRGGQALAPDIRKVLGAISAADGYDDLRARLVKTFRGMRPQDFARIISRTRMLASLAGQGDVLALL